MALPKNFKIDDETQYRVQLAERVEVAGEKLAPGQDVVILGLELKNIRDKVDHAEEV